MIFLFCSFDFLWFSRQKILLSLFIPPPPSAFLLFFFLNLECPQKKRCSTFRAYGVYINVLLNHADVKRSRFSSSWETTGQWWWGRVGMERRGIKVNFFFVENYFGHEDSVLYAVSSLVITLSAAMTVILCSLWHCFRCCLFCKFERFYNVPIFDFFFFCP